MTTSAKIPLIDRTVAIKHLSKLITNELDSLQISEQKLGWLMGGLSQERLINSDRANLIIFPISIR